MIESVNIIVDETVVAHNTALLKKTLNPETKIISVIKANGYGLGIVEIARTCEKMGIDVLAVLDIEQALSLRHAGITAPILLMGATLESNFELLVEYDLIQVLIDFEFAKRLSNFGVEHGCKVKSHVKVNTGLNRLGMRNYDEIKACYALPGLDVLGIYSHFVEAQSYEGDALAFSYMQIERFNNVLASLKEDAIQPGMTHMQNSPSILNFGDLGYTAVRCGMVMFGLFHPSQLEMAAELGYKIPIAMQSRVAMIRNIQKGEFIGYSRSFEAPCDMRIATISAGYCDGIMKAFSLHGGGVYIRDTWCPILGDIAMSQFMVDVSALECASEDIVWIFGCPGQSIYDYRNITGQSINELISHLRYTIPRIYINPIQ